MLPGYLVRTALKECIRIVLTGCTIIWREFLYLYIFLKFGIMESKKIFIRISGIIFGMVAVLHLLRITTGIQVLIGDFSLPIWVNWMGFFATSFLCFWLWKFSFSKM